MDALTEIAPLATWLRVSAASVLLLLAFTVLSHVVVHVQAYGHGWGGLAAAGPVERAVRLGWALLLLGVLTWGWDLGWSGWILAALGGGVGLALALEAVAAARGGGRARAGG